MADFANLFVILFLSYIVGDGDGVSMFIYILKYLCAFGHLFNGYTLLGSLREVHYG